MRIKKFSEFFKETSEITNDVNEREYYIGPYRENKSKFSGWLREVADRNDKNIKKVDSIPNGNDDMPSLTSAANLLPTILKSVFNSSAAVADFFTKGNSKDDTISKMNKTELRNNREPFINKWETETFNNDRKITQREIDKFYRDATTKGRKYFGPRFNLITPNNSEEKSYAEYVKDSLSRYYKRTE